MMIDSSELERAAREPPSSRASTKPNSLEPIRHSPRTDPLDREDRALVRALTSRPSVRIPILVSPMASGDELVGWQDGVLRIRVVASDRDGADDRAVESLLADVLSIEASRVRVLLGTGSRRKWVEIDDYDELDLERDLPGRWASADETA